MSIQSVINLVRKRATKIDSALGALPSWLAYPLVLLIFGLFMYVWVRLAELPVALVRSLTSGMNLFGMLGLGSLDLEILLFLEDHYDDSTLAVMMASFFWWILFSSFSSEEQGKPLGPHHRDTRSNRRHYRHRRSPTPDRSLVAGLVAVGRMVMAFVDAHSLRLRGTR